MLLHHLPPVELWQREAMSRHLHAGDLGVHAERSVGCDVFAETSVKRRQYRHGPSHERCGDGPLQSPPCRLANTGVMTFPCTSSQASRMPRMPLIQPNLVAEPVWDEVSENIAQRPSLGTGSASDSACRGSS